MSTKLRFCRPMLNSMYRISRGPGSSSPKSRPPPLPFSSSSTRLSHLDDDEERGSDVDVGVDVVVALDWRVVHVLHVLSRANNDAKGLSASDGENANDSSADIMTKHTRAAAEAVGELMSMAAMCGCRWENGKIAKMKSGRNAGDGKTVHAYVRTTRSYYVVRT